MVHERNLCLHIKEVRDHRAAILGGSIYKAELVVRWECAHIWYFSAGFEEIDIEWWVEMCVDIDDRAFGGSLGCCSYSSSCHIWRRQWGTISKAVILVLGSNSRKI
jgi:hypothetical protein